MYDEWFSLISDPDIAFHFYEGDGSNLWESDEKEGYVDYFIYDFYVRDPDTGKWDMKDGGQILTKKTISEMTRDEKLACLDQMVFEFNEDGSPANIIRADNVQEIDPENETGLEM